MMIFSNGKSSTFDYLQLRASVEKKNLTGLHITGKNYFCRMIRYIWLIKYRCIKRIHTLGEMLKKQKKKKIGERTQRTPADPIAVAQRTAISHIRGKNGKRLLARVT